MFKFAPMAATMTWLLLGCPSVPSSDVPDIEAQDAVSSFDDRTTSSFSTAEAFHAWADSGMSPQQVKFAFARFGEEDSDAHFYDPRFYALHDEWYWYRLLNNQGFADYPVMPLSGFSFASIAEVYETFADSTSLPLDLRFTSSGRLYSPLFYEAALGKGAFKQGRYFGVGSLLYYAPDPKRAFPDAIYCFELEFVDNSEEEGVLRFYDKLRAALPESIGEQLRWLSRGSTHQDELAQTIRKGDGPLRDHVLTYADLVIPGEQIPYNEGITAGYVKLFDESVGASLVSSRDIVVLGKVPDDLPPVSGIVTAVPQTPLAHLNLLAKARGTPNVYIGGIFSNEWLKEWSYWKVPVILKVDSDGGRWQKISNDEYQTYLTKLLGGNLSLTAIDVTDAPYTVDLTTGGLAELGELVPLTGGKAAGMRAFSDFPDIEVPFQPLALTIRGYKEHLESYRPMLTKALDDEGFQKDARVRFVFFEGSEAFLAEHVSDPQSEPWLMAWLNENGPESKLGGAVAVGGFKALLRSKPLNAELVETLQSELSQRYAQLSPLQGLRFRSSSTAEDIKGFNGAGLYDSNTGFLFPQEQPTKKLRKRNIEWALKKTWASYWSYEAFEERRIAGINHLSGNMGVLVHPRFDDLMELANGVITFTLKRGHASTSFAMLVNAQKGAISVTNPDPSTPTSPEIVRIAGVDDQKPVVERLQASSVAHPDEDVLSTEILIDTYHQLRTVAEAWLDEENKAWPLAKQSRTLVLDLEFKRMSKNWPQRRDGQLAQDRMILKQIRTLEGAIKVGDELEDEPTPRDILAVTRRVDRRTCTGEDFSITLLEFYTEQAMSSLVDHWESPFINRATLEFKQPPANFQVPNGAFETLHTEWKTVSLGNYPKGPWELDMVLNQSTSQELGFSRLKLDSNGTWSLGNETSTYQGKELTCVVDIVSVGPTEYLEDLLDD